MHLSGTFEMLDRRLISLQLLSSILLFLLYMGTTSARFKSSGKEQVSKQLLKFFQRNSAKSIPNSLIILVGMSSDFKAFFMFNFLIIEVALSVLTF